MVSPEETLYWVVPPTESKPGELPYFAFQPRESDQGLTSLYQSSQITPRDCLRQYNANPNRPQAVQVAQIPASAFLDRNIPLKPDPKPHPAHLLADFTPLGKRQIKIITRELRQISESIGILQP